MHERENSNSKDWRSQPGEMQLQALSNTGCVVEQGTSKETVSEQVRKRTLSLLQSMKTNIAILRGGGRQMMRSPHHKILQISTVNSADNGLNMIGQINNILCHVVIDTGVNMIITIEDLVQKPKVIWMPPCVSLQTVAGDKIRVY
ncbi:hypothetical protein TNCV_546651 [Trichonephila clavipes]|nr:hypothetical protein TNCV_546651 [Trichonephila clavipes]